MILLSLAVYGLWHIVQDIWGAWVALRGDKRICASLLMVVRDSEQQIEGMVRDLLRLMEGDSFWQEVVIVDYASTDITPAILDRLAARYSQVQAVHLSGAARPVAEGIALCHGEVVYVLDFVNRLYAEDLVSVVNRIQRPWPSFYAS